MRDVSENVIEVGAKVRRGHWGDEHVVITAVGERRFLAKSAASEISHSKYGDWERYVEPPTDEKFITLYDQTWEREAVAIRNSNGEWRIEAVK